MKKILKTSISIVLTLAICLSMFCGMTFSTVYAAESVDKGENILAGLMPVANYMTTTNGISDSWGVYYVSDKGNLSFNDYGSDKRSNAETADAAYQALNLGSLANLTDGSSSTKITLSHSMAPRKMVVIYKLNGDYNLKNVSITFANSTGARAFKVYAGLERGTLLNGDAIGSVSLGGTATVTYSFDSDVTARYIAVVLEKDESAWAFNVAEIAAYGVELTNAVSGLMPVANYMTKNATSTGSAWSVSYGGAGKSNLSLHDYGADKQGTVANVDAAYQALGAGSLANMTDGSTDTKTQIGDVLDTKNMIVIYKLPTEYNVKHISITYSSSVARQLNVYVGTDRATLFNTTPVLTTAEKSQIQSIDIDRTANYVAFVLGYAAGSNAWGSHQIAEIAAYGVELTNAVSGLLPVANYMTVSNTNYSCSCLLNHSSTGNTGALQVLDYGACAGKHATIESANAKYNEIGAGKFENLTDGDISTNINLSNVLNNKKTIIIYRLNAEYNLKHIDITYNTSRATQLDIYVGTDRATLLTGEAVHSVSASDAATQIQSVDIDKTARYIALVLGMNNAWGSHTVAEIAAYGIQTGELNVAQNAKPVAVYTANAGSTAYGWEKSQIGSVTGSAYAWKPFEVADSAEILTTYPDLVNITDDNSLTSTSLSTLTNGKDFAIVYKLDTIYDIDKVQVVADSLNGVRIYVARTRATLFNADNMVEEFGLGEEATVNFAEAKIGNYVGFVFTGNTDTRTYNVKDIVIYGNAVGAETDAEDIIGSVSPVNPNASNGAKSFYQYLNNVKYEEAILTGAHLINPANDINSLDYVYGTPSISYNYYSYLEKNYGISPSIVSGSRDLGVSYYANAYEDGIVPMFFGLTNFHGEEYGAGNVRYLDLDYLDTLTEGTDEYDAAYNLYDKYESVLEEWASFFQELEENGVDSYIFRPFAEMNVTGFFGNNRTSTHLNATKVHFKNVWQQMYDYFVNEKGLTGILFAWSPSGTVTTINPDVMDYYPGNNYVDIVAPTIYSVDGTGELPVALQYDEMLATGKPFGISETSPRNFNPADTTGDCSKLLESFKTTYKQASFANLWYGVGHAISENDNAEAFIKDDYLISIQNQANHNVEMVQAEEKAILYSDVSLGGTAAKITAGAFDVADLGDVNMTSIDLNDGMKITLYDAKGDAWVFGKDVTDLSTIEFTSFVIEAAEEYTTGDIKDDGEINILDLVALKKYLIGTREASILACDMNEDGKANSMDLTEMRKYLLGIR